MFLTTSIHFLFLVFLGMLSLVLLLIIVVLIYSFYQYRESVQASRWSEVINKRISEVQWKISDDEHCQYPPVW